MAELAEMRGEPNASKICSRPIPFFAAGISAVVEVPFGTAAGVLTGAGVRTGAAVGAADGAADGAGVAPACVTFVAVIFELNAPVPETETFSLTNGLVPANAVVDVV